MARKNNNVIISAAVLSILSTVFADLNYASEIIQDKTKTEIIKKEVERCYGINSCRGKGQCGGKGHSCAGLNDCKGRGYINVEKNNCKDIQNGSLTPIKENQG